MALIRIQTAALHGTQRLGGASLLLALWGSERTPFVTAPPHGKGTSSLVPQLRSQITQVSLAGRGAVSDTQQLLLLCLVVLGRDHALVAELGQLLQLGRVV